MPKTLASGRRIIAAMAATALVASLGGCASAPAEESTSDKPLVLTTFTVIADMVRVVGGDHVDVESITKVGAEIHGYEPTPSDLRNAASADLILDNGLGLERWFEQFVERLDVPHAVLTEGIEPIDIAGGEYLGRPNPHAWMSPVAGQQYVANIAEGLSDLVPEHAADFEAAAKEYSAELETLVAELEAAVQELPEERRVLVTCEGAFSYLARDLGLSEGYLWPVNSDTQGTPQQVKSAIELVRAGNVPAVFCETTVDDGAMRQVASESGAKFAGNLYVDSLSEEGGPVPTYLDLLRHDISVIAEGLGRG
ncbi:metal ABC transporter substrate-binding protein [Salinibacterium sp. dk2585]|uniref:metal ABC transporter substrate-binding protein n=1 Tax=unclassified Salinibacterium TaxID=2632331 RepID=UPI0011C24BB4|nr:MULTISPECIES: metal ABC transporter substrate-binding protein [unclassified Salinibacterium]QEE61830.1 metal ABC transporter substrate-binding protein [Salinibacterium sp. dk2585]TXK54615.1 metal ABC transporter substrate-binding protein [Salinibacterium sp. dk5596]